MRLALTAGGTGGHIIPALAVYDAICARPGTAPEVRFFGPEDRGERRTVEARGVRFEGVPAAGVRGRGPWRLMKSVARLAWGSAIALRRLRAFDPDAVFSTGGYGSFPCSLAARLLRRPLVVYLPDVTPGWAVRAERRLATRMATTAEAALAFLPRGKTTVTGYPVRAAFFNEDRAGARAALGLGADEPLVVIAGASQGARTINRAVFRALPALVAHATVVHITGDADAAEAAAVSATLDPERRTRYLAARYRDDLPTVMVAADVAVMRAGASVLGEIPAAGLPAILVPGTYAGAHQRANARWLEQAGAAVILEEAALDRLPEVISDLLADRGRMEAMRAAARALARPNAAAFIAELLVEVARR